mgnify:CR=1 FL=1
MKQEVPELYRHLVSLDRAIAESGIDPVLLELIKIRTSQINRCAYCIDLHSTAALQKGESVQRLFALSAWSESPLFTEAEKAVLQVTEAIALIHKQGVCMQSYEELRSFFDQKGIAKLVMAMIMINAWNRSAISSQIQYT